MRKNKLCYEAPSAEVLVVRFEEGLMTGTYGVQDQAGSTLGRRIFDDDDEF